MSGQTERSPDLYCGTSRANLPTQMLITFVIIFYRQKYYIWILDTNMWNRQHLFIPEIMLGNIHLGIQIF